ncbi:hypothetical protein [Sphingomonas solaris]|nr:hypothetical protein [Sphingomonas solaris]
MRDPSWRGVKQMLVLAQYGPAGMVAGGVESDALCAEVLALAKHGAPVSVACTHIGDRALAAPGALVLVVQASVTQQPHGAVFAVTARPDYQGGLEPAGIRFGAAPRLAAWREGPAGAAARAVALDAALNDILPWRRPPGGRAPGLTEE